MSRRFLRLGPSLVASATRCIADTFAAQSRTDPFTALFEYTPVHWANMVSSFVERAGAAKRPLSVVSVGASGEVEGVMLNEDWTTPTPLAYNKLGPEWRSTRAIFKELHTRYNDKHSSSSLVPQECLHTLYFTCVAPTVRGQGVMKGLWLATVDIAQQEGFSHILAESGREDVRQVLADNLGFREVAAVDFSSFNVGSTSFGSLQKIDPVQFTRLSLMKRAVPSNLY